MATTDFKRTFAEGEREQAFWHEHWRELMDQYPEEFVAARDGHVIAHDPDLRRLVASLSDDDLLGIWLRFVSNTRGSHIL
jgi:hypothetical protein